MTKDKTVKKLYPLLLAALIGLGGCSAKNEMAQLFSHDTLYEKAVAYTREGQIVRELETKAAVSATLLNEIFPKKYPYSEGVYFFVGIVSPLEPEEIQKNYHIAMNGESPLSIKQIKEEDTLYKLMPNVNRWGKYFVVTFPPTSAKNLTIDFGIYPYGSVTLKFQRPLPR